MSITDATRQRSIDLAGEIKRARDVMAECERAAQEKLNAYEGALDDSKASRERLEALLNERDALAAKAQAEVLAAGEDASAPAEATVSFDAIAHLAHNANGHAKVADSELPQF